MPLGRRDLEPMSAISTKGAPRIVVGVDGSPSSRAALRWAVRQAKFMSGTVDAVIAWQIPMVLQSYGWAPIYVEEEGNFREDARKRIDALIGEVVEQADSRRVRSLVIKGHAAEALIEAAEGADRWWSAAAAGAASPRHCSARSASTACITRPARC